MPQAVQGDRAVVSYIAFVNPIAVGYIAIYHLELPIRCADLLGVFQITVGVIQVAQVAGVGSRIDGKRGVKSHISG